MYVTVIFKIYSVGPGASDCIAEDFIYMSAIYLIYCGFVGIR